MDRRPPLAKLAPASAHSARLRRIGQAARFARRPLGAVLTYAFLAPAYAQLPAGATVIHGSATIATSGARMTVTNSPNSILNWQSFSVGAPNGVHFQQQNASSQVLNRVTGADPSQILGSLSSNGRVWLINPRGILFGQNARIDVAGLVASTLDISNADFLANRFNFAAASGAGHAEVFNHGEIRTSFGGRVWLLGDKVRNEGLIETPGGNIVLAAGKSIELIDSGLPNVIVRVNAPENEAVNVGTLVASGGSIDLHGSIVNQEGIVRADRIGTDAAGRMVLRASDAVTLSEGSQTTAPGGSVHLEANTVNNRGKIGGQEVSVAADQILQQGEIKAPGGRITLTAGSSTYLDGTVDVSDPLGRGGSIWLTTGKLEGMAGGSLRADGRQGGSIHVEGRGMVAFSSTFSAAGRENGGQIEVTGDSVLLLNADVDTSGGQQGGSIHLGGGWQGSSDLPHAREVVVGVGSEVQANAAASTVSAGRGGEVVVWSSESSEHYGSLQATDGGRIELSSKGTIRQTGELQVGPGGSVLFDPKNLIITDSLPDSLTMARKVTSGSVGGQPSLQVGDRFGTAVALQGDLLAIGAPFDRVPIDQGGAVHLFTGVGTDFSGLTWQKKLASGMGAIGMPTLNTSNQRDRFGTSVSLESDRLVVGAPGHFGAGVPVPSLGEVHLFSGVGTDFSGLTWRGKLTSQLGASGMPALRAGDLFGTAVALNGDRLAVGAPGFIDAPGAVHLFTGVGTDFSVLTWRRVVTSNTGASGMPVMINNVQFGYAVALDGDRLVVGVPQDNTTGSGSAMLFTGVGTDFSGLAYRRKLYNGNGMPPWRVAADKFGLSVSLDGDRLAVGSRQEDTGGLDRGAAHLFSGVGTDFSALTWQRRIVNPADALGMPGLVDSDWFGYSLALDGDRLAVGALEVGRAAPIGSVYLFTGVSTMVPDTSFLRPAVVTTMLNAGTLVTLQADNDITVSTPVLSAGGGAGGRLQLRAGRHIDFQAAVSLDGILSAVAGDPAANAAFRDPGTPTLTIASGVTLRSASVGQAASVSLAAIGGDVINNAGDAAISTPGHWAIYAANPTTSSEGFTLYSKQYDQPYGSGVLPAYATTGNWFLYSIAPTLAVNPATQTITYGEMPSLTPTFTGFIDGDTAATAGLTGRATWSMAGPRSSSGNLAAGIHDVSFAGGLSSSLGYRFADDPTSVNELTVRAKPLTATYTADHKVYDGNPTATGSGSSVDLIVGDAVSFRQTAAFRDKNVDTAKGVDIADIALTGPDAGNYALQNTTASASADITPATLTYVASLITRTTGAEISGLGGAVVGFVGSDTLATDTSGTLVWTTATTYSSRAGVYPIHGGGLAAKNYAFAQAPTNAGALTLVAALVSEALRDEAVAASVQGTNSAIQMALPWQDQGGGGVIDTTATTQYASLIESATLTGIADETTTSMLVVGKSGKAEEAAARTPDAGEGAAARTQQAALAIDRAQTAARMPSFGSLYLAQMTPDEIEAALDARRRFKRKLLADALNKVEEDPGLAEVRLCASLAHVDSGLCRVTDQQRDELLVQMANRDLPKGARRVKVVRLPQIGRKVAVLFGVNDYADRTVPRLDNAVADVEMVGSLFAERLGYEARIVRNPTKADLVRTLNQLSAEVSARDSVMIYYAGHGEQTASGVGYWLPTDASAKNPTNWISNIDVSKMLASVTAKQVVMISDSCYAGAFAGEKEVGLSGKEINPDEVLARRSVVIMTSGGNEPVADGSSFGHSFFAWQLARRLLEVENWRAGTHIFEQIRRDVLDVLWQEPQYGAAPSAGHQQGGDYLFEFRQLEEAR